MEFTKKIVDSLDLDPPLAGLIIGETPTSLVDPPMESGNLLNAGPVQLLQTR